MENIDYLKARSGVLFNEHREIKRILNEYSGKSISIKEAMQEINSIVSIINITDDNLTLLNTMNDKGDE